MRVLITGAGMVGCHLAKELADGGDEVTLYELRPVMPYIEGICGPRRVRVVRGDLLSFPDLARAVRDARCDCLVHTAALLGVSVTAAAYTGIRVNVLGTANVVEAAALHGVGRVVYTSTMGVYNWSVPGPITESHPLGPAELYGATKVAAEQVGIQHARLLGIGFVALRYAIGYGPTFSAGGALFGRTIQEVVLGAARGLPVRVERSGPFAVGRDWVYARDMSHAAALAVRAGHVPTGVFNIGSGRLNTLDELAEAVGEVVPGARIEVVSAPQPGPDVPPGFPYDLSRARAGLGYEPAFDLRAGVADYLERRALLEACGAS